MGRPANLISSEVKAARALLDGRNVIWRGLSVSLPTIKRLEIEAGS